MLPIPVDPCGDESEAIETRTRRSMTGTQIEDDALSIEGHDDAPATLGSLGIVFE
jgi:hypothetical protein